MRILEDYSNNVDMQDILKQKESSTNDQRNRQLDMDRKGILARARDLTASGSQGRKLMVDTLKSILIECLDSKVEESTYTRPGD